MESRSCSTLQYRVWQLVLLAFVSFAKLTFGQTAPQRSDELCSTLKLSALDSGRKFMVTKPGACRMNLDDAYALFVDYMPQTVHIGMTFDPAILRGDASAFWLRLSTLDNLVQTAFQTKQRAVFDELNRLVAGELAPYLLKHNAVPDQMLHSRTQKVALGVTMDPKTAIIALIASADVIDIEKMQKSRQREASGETATWRKVLAVSLQAFAAGAKNYSDAQANAQRNTPPPRTILNSRQTCYTNFIGRTAFTNCY